MFGNLLNFGHPQGQQSGVPLGLFGSLLNGLGGSGGGIIGPMMAGGRLLTSITGGPDKSHQNAVTNLSNNLGFGWLAKLTEKLGIPTLGDI